MTEQELAERNLILKVRTGSHLYGTNTEESDEDFVGIFVPDKKYLIGLNRIEQVDSSIVSKDISGKNTKDAVDCTYYTLEKFSRLALDNNPNIVEILFVNKENIIYSNYCGEELLKLKYHFLSKNIKHRFLGYAFSQKHKMIVKLDNYERIDEAIEYLQQCNLDYVNEINYHPLFNRKDKLITVGDVNMPANITIKKAIQSLTQRRDKFSGNRRELVSKHGYDSRFGMHLIRLMFEGIELLSTGDLIFPLSERELLLNIKKGYYSLKAILTCADELERNIEELVERTELRSKPDFDTINDYVMSIHKEYI